MKEAGLRLFAHEAPVAANDGVLSSLRLVTRERPKADTEPAPIAPQARAQATLVGTPAAPSSTTHVALEQQIVEELARAAPPGLSASEAFRDKELKLGELFASLSTADSRTLHHRLTCPKANDAIAMGFGRLVPERQARLLAFLADARRRAAIAVGGRR